MLHWAATVAVALTLAVLLTLLFCSTSHAHPGHPYGERPIRVVVPYPPAGGTDILTRYIMRKVEERTGWTVVIENMGGATGVMGTRVVAHAKPDGYTLLMGHIAPNAINPGAFLSPPEPADWRLVPVGMGAIAPTLLLVREETGIKSVADLRAWLAKTPDPTYASDGVGSACHLQMELLLEGKKATHVPYKGGGPAIQGLLSNDVALMFSPAPVALSHVGHKSFRVIGQTGPLRLPAVRDVPTMREAGLPILDAPLWWGMFAPVGTPLEIISAWNAQLRAVATDPVVVAWMEKLGYAPDPMSVDAFTKFVEKDAARWATVTARVVAKQ